MGLGDLAQGAIGQVKDKFKNEFNEWKEKADMSKESLENIKSMWADGSEYNYDITSASQIDMLQDLGISDYETVKKMAKLEASTLGKYGSILSGIGIDTGGVSNALNTGLSIYSMANNIAGMFMTQVFKRHLGTTPPSAMDRTIGTKDPISSDVDIRERIYNIVERCGYAQDKTLAVGYSRNYIYTSKPTLASDASGHYKSFVFITRPNLNLIESNDDGMIRLVPSLLNYNQLFSLITTDPKLFGELCRDGARKSNLFMLLSNYVKEVPPVKLSETERSGIENKYGYSTPLPGLPEYHNVDVSVTFNDNYRGDIAKLLQAIAEYRHNVSKRGFAMRPEYTKNKADDTLMSMYVVTTTPDMEIVSFGVFLNGVIGDIPTHTTQFKTEGFSKDELLDNFTVTFKFSTYYPHCPLYYDYFNNIFNFNPMDCVDLKGSEHHMVSPGRTMDVETSGNSSRTSLFGMDFGVKMDLSLLPVNGIVDKAQGFMDNINDKVDSAKNLLMYTDTFNTVKNMFEYDKVTDTSSDIVETVKYRYKGQFEFLAKRPGVYAAANTNPLEKGRVIYRLGFSY